MIGQCFLVRQQHAGPRVWTLGRPQRQQILPDKRSLDEWRYIQATAPTTRRLVRAADTDGGWCRPATLSLVLLRLIALSPKVGDQHQPLVEE
jgi:hypothetical protein